MGICRVTLRGPGGGQSRERFYTVIKHPRTVTEELAAVMDGGAL